MDGVGAVGAWLGHSSKSVGGKRWLATVRGQPVCKGDLEFMGGGGENRVHFSCQDAAMPCSQWNGDPNGPTLPLQKISSSVQ